MFKRTLLMCAVSLLCSRQGNASDFDSGPVEFDSETLKSLGIDPGVSGYFAHQARFMPGNIPVTLAVNGMEWRKAVLSPGLIRTESCVSIAH